MQIWQALALSLVFPYRLGFLPCIYAGKNLAEKEKKMKAVFPFIGGHVCNRKNVYLVDVKKGCKVSASQLNDFP